MVYLQPTDVNHCSCGIEAGSGTGLEKYLGQGLQVLGVQGTGKTPAFIDASSSEAIWLIYQFGMATTRNRLQSTNVHCKYYL
ncbi:unnamed protein product [Anisakis simplex]|uniref:TraG-D_C domain-containing protein n=1 Tax=Anisakis simplex TaxID=6269 RepID=A0A0M3KA89_ANISI|nr:unnamed protein product [Anisakis simplex]